MALALAVYQGGEASAGEPFAALTLPPGALGFDPDDDGAVSYADRFNDSPIDRW
jgi:hypothetical protein